MLGLSYSRGREKELLGLEGACRMVPRPWQLEGWGQVVQQW